MTSFFSRDPVKHNPALMPFTRRRSKEYDRYATFNRRMIAATLDSAILMCFTPLFDIISPIDRSGLANIDIPEGHPNPGLVILLGMLSDKAFVNSWLENFLVQANAFLLYAAVFWTIFQATPGKMLVRIKVVDAKTEGPLSVTQILLRLAGYVISLSFFALGLFWIGMNKKRRAWHDYLADTVVLVQPLNLGRKPNAAAKNDDTTPTPPDNVNESPPDHETPAN